MTQEPPIWHDMTWYDLQYINLSQLAMFLKLFLKLPESIPPKNLTIHSEDSENHWRVDIGLNVWNDMLVGGLNPSEKY